MTGYSPACGPRPCPLRIWSPASKLATASNERPAGYIPEILATVLEPAKGYRIEAMDEFYPAYTSRTAAEGKRAVAPRIALLFVGPTVVGDLTAFGSPLNVFARMLEFLFLAAVHRLPGIARGGIRDCPACRRDPRETEQKLMQEALNLRFAKARSCLEQHYPICFDAELGLRTFWMLGVSTLLLAIPLLVLHVSFQVFGIDVMA